MDTRKRTKEAATSLAIAESLSIPKRMKVHAQRKFALGAPIHPINSAVAPINEFEGYCINSEHQIAKRKRVDFNLNTKLKGKSAVRPKTEDFLTFLCYRRTPALPPDLEIFESPQYSEMINYMYDDVDENNVEESLTAPKKSFVDKKKQKDLFKEETDENAIRSRLTRSSTKSENSVTGTAKKKLLKKNISLKKVAYLKKAKALQNSSLTSDSRSIFTRGSLLRSKKLKNKSNSPRILQRLSSPKVTKNSSETRSTRNALNKTDRKISPSTSRDLRKTPQKSPSTKKGLRLRRLVRSVRRNYREIDGGSGDESLTKNRDKSPLKNVDLRKINKRQSVVLKKLSPRHVVSSGSLKKQSKTKSPKSFDAKNQRAKIMPRKTRSSIDLEHILTSTRVRSTPPRIRSPPPRYRDSPPRFSTPTPKSKRSASRSAVLSSRIKSTSKEKNSAKSLASPSKSPRVIEKYSRFSPEEVNFSNVKSNRVKKFLKFPNKKETILKGQKDEVNTEALKVAELTEETSHECVSKRSVTKYRSKRIEAKIVNKKAGSKCGNKISEIKNDKLKCAAELNRGNKVKEIENDKLKCAAELKCGNKVKEIENDKLQCSAELKCGSENIGIKIDKPERVESIEKKCEVKSIEKKCEVKSIETKCEVKSKAVGELKSDEAVCEIKNKETVYEDKSNKVACEIKNNEVQCESKNSEVKCKIKSLETDCESRDPEIELVCKNTDAKSEFVGKTTDAKSEFVSKTTDAKSEFVSKTTDAKSEFVSKTSDAKSEFVSKSADATSEFVSKTTDAKSEFVSKTTDAKSKFVSKTTDAKSEKENCKTGSSNNKTESETKRHETKCDSEKSLCESIVETPEKGKTSVHSVVEKYSDSLTHTKVLNLKRRNSSNEIIFPKKLSKGRRYSLSEMRKPNLKEVVPKGSKFSFNLSSKEIRKPSVKEVDEDLNEVLESVAKGFERELDDSIYNELEKNLNMGNKSPDEFKPKDVLDGSVKSLGSSCEVFAKKSLINDLKTEVKKKDENLSLNKIENNEAKGQSVDSEKKSLMKPKSIEIKQNSQKNEAKSSPRKRLWDVVKKLQKKKLAESSRCAFTVRHDNKNLNLPKISSKSQSFKNTESSTKTQSNNVTAQSALSSSTAQLTAIAPRSTPIISGTQVVEQDKVVKTDTNVPNCIKEKKNTNSASYSLMEKVFKSSSEVNPIEPIQNDNEIFITANSVTTDFMPKTTVSSAQLKSEKSDKNEKTDRVELKIPKFTSKSSLEESYKKTISEVISKMTANILPLKVMNKSIVSNTSNISTLKVMSKAIVSNTGNISPLKVMSKAIVSGAADTSPLRVMSKAIVSGAADTSPLRVMSRTIVSSTLPHVSICESIIPQSLIVTNSLNSMLQSKGLMIESNLNSPTIPKTPDRSRKPKNGSKQILIAPRPPSTSKSSACNTPSKNVSKQIQIAPKPDFSKESNVPTASAYLPTTSNVVQSPIGHMIQGVNNSIQNVQSIQQLPHLQAMHSVQTLPNISALTCMNSSVQAVLNQSSIVNQSQFLTQSASKLITQPAFATPPLQLSNIVPTFDLSLQSNGNSSKLSGVTQVMPQNLIPKFITESQQSILSMNQQRFVSITPKTIVTNALNQNLTFQQTVSSSPAVCLPQQFLTLNMMPVGATQILPNGGQASHILPNATQATQVLPNGAQMSHVLPNGSQIASILSSGAQMTQLLSNGGQMAQILPNSGQIARILPNSGQMSQILPNSGQMSQILPNPGQSTTQMNSIVAEETLKISASVTRTISSLINNLSQIAPAMQTNVPISNQATTIGRIVSGSSLFPISAVMESPVTTNPETLPNPIPSDLNTCLKNVLNKGQNNSSVEVSSITKSNMKSLNDVNSSLNLSSNSDKNINEVSNNLNEDKSLYDESDGNLQIVWNDDLENCSKIEANIENSTSLRDNAEITSNAHTHNTSSENLPKALPTLSLISCNSKQLILPHLPDLGVSVPSSKAVTKLAQSSPPYLLSPSLEDYRSEVQKKNKCSSDNIVLDAQLKSSTSTSSLAYTPEKSNTSLSSLANLQPISSKKSNLEFSTLSEALVRNIFPNKALNNSGKRLQMEIDKNLPLHKKSKSGSCVKTADESLNRLADNINKACTKTIKSKIPETCIVQSESLNLANQSKISGCKSKSKILDPTKKSKVLDNANLHKLLDSETKYSPLTSPTKLGSSSSTNKTKISDSPSRKSLLFKSRNSSSSCSTAFSPLYESSIYDFEPEQDLCFEIKPPLLKRSKSTRPDSISLTDLTITVTSSSRSNFFDSKSSIQSAEPEKQEKLCKSRDNAKELESNCKLKITKPVGKSEKLIKSKDSKNANKNITKSSEEKSAKNVKPKSAIKKSMNSSNKNIPQTKASDVAKEKTGNKSKISKNTSIMDSDFSASTLNERTANEDSDTSTTTINKNSACISEAATPSSNKEKKSSASIATQCDFDFNKEKTSSLAQADLKTPIPPSASPFYYLPLAMATLGEKIPAQLVQQMLSKTQGLIGSTEAGLILQQAAQLAKKYNINMSGESSESSTSQSSTVKPISPRSVTDALEKALRANLESIAEAQKLLSSNNSEGENSIEPGPSNEKSFLAASTPKAKPKPKTSSRKLKDKLSENEKSEDESEWTFKELKVSGEILNSDFESIFSELENDKTLMSSDDNLEQTEPKSKKQTEYLVKRRRDFSDDNSEQSESHSKKQTEYLDKRRRDFSDDNSEQSESHSKNFKTKLQKEFCHKKRKDLISDSSKRRSSRSTTSAATRATESDQMEVEELKKFRRAKKVANILKGEPIGSPLEAPFSPASIKSSRRNSSPASSHCSERTTISQRSKSSYKSSIGGSEKETKRRGKHNRSYNTDSETSHLNVSHDSRLIEAPTFRPTEQEFIDPMDYIDKIRPEVESFGLCRIVPPKGFRPECRVSDEMRFTPCNQYIHRMMNRWGPADRVNAAIKLCLSKQNVDISANPVIGGLELDLGSLYNSVESHGGLMKVIEKEQWNKIADGLKIPKSSQDRASRLDNIYCSYLLPYATLTKSERHAILKEVDARYSRASQCVAEDDEDQETLECIIRGKSTTLGAFYRVARNVATHWRQGSVANSKKSIDSSTFDEQYWDLVKESDRYFCVNNASIDTFEHGYGFPCPKTSENAKHPWNLKDFCQNSKTVLKSLPNVIGVSAPTLHIGMMYSTLCWYRDPHGLPWIEYVHSGASKIWYGVPSSNEKVFRAALRRLVPGLIKESPLWLPSDAVMVPPVELMELGVEVCRVVQEPGEFVVIFPSSFTSSICSGYIISESAFFARPEYLSKAAKWFEVLRECCEPSMLCLEQLALCVANDSKSCLEALLAVRPFLGTAIENEKKLRKTLLKLGLKSCEKRSNNPHKKRKLSSSSISQDENCCEVCKQSLYFSMVLNKEDDVKYCLQHACTVTVNDDSLLEKSKLVYCYSLPELANALKQLDERIISITDKKSLSKKTR